MPFTPSAPREQGILEFLKETQAGATKGAVAGQEFGQKITELQFRKQMGIKDETETLADIQATLAKPMTEYQQHLKRYREWQMKQRKKGVADKSLSEALTLSMRNLSMSKVYEYDDPAKSELYKKSAEEFLIKANNMKINIPQWYIDEFEVVEPGFALPIIGEIGKPTTRIERVVRRKGKMIKPADVTDADWKIANDETKRALIRMFR